VRQHRLLRDEGTPQLTKTDADGRVSIPITLLGLTRLDIVPPSALPPVHEDLDFTRRFLRGEVPPQKVK
jgi:hypothetical protein